WGSQDESYDPIANNWARHTDLLHGRYQATLVVSNGRLFVCGGLQWIEKCDTVDTIEEYLPDSDEWIERGEFRVYDISQAKILTVPVPASIPIEGIFKKYDFLLLFVKLFR
ncbi:hypothetical protein PRIPAC_87304, partial [Pristionchus pacificus]|uniref:Uncharacterized protein n=1 Tax=Pristionchus pacificus TaxID=54126 RepID=A0A2A6B6U5_PRIPA